MSDQVQRKDESDQGNHKGKGANRLNVLPIEETEAESRPEPE